MSLGFKPECFQCGDTFSEFWKKVEGKGPCCRSCSVKVEPVEDEAMDCESEDLKKPKDGTEKQAKKGETSSNGTKTVNGANRGRKTGKGKAKKVIPALPKGKGRRFIFKKTVYKAPPAICKIINSPSLLFEGQYYQIGDIVCLRDVDGGIYYAQIRGLLQDQYCEKSAVISWLIPTRSSPPPENGFLPESYILGPHEDIPRKLDCMEWVCHAPSDYYHARGSPFPVGDARPELGFSWTNSGLPLIRPVSELQETSKRGELDQNQE